MGSVCSHVAALLFKLEACIRTGIFKTAVTNLKCQWNKSQKNAQPDTLQNINFKRPKRSQLPFENNKKPMKQIKNFSTHPDLSVKNISKNLIDELRTIAPNAAFFTSMHDNGCNSDNIEYSTATADENEENIFPEPMTSLFDFEAINLGNDKLQELCLLKYENYKNNYTEQSYNLLSDITKTQSLSKIWKLHRAGRITASNFHGAMHFSYKKTKFTLLQKLMNYVSTPNVPSINYGREMESKALTFYKSLLSNCHTNVTINQAGLVVPANEPFLGASPDGIVTCSCHDEEWLVEIKCPYKYREGLNNWKLDTNFPIDSSGHIKKNF